MFHLSYWKTINCYLISVFCCEPNKELNLVPVSNNKTHIKTKMPATDCFAVESSGGGGKSKKETLSRVWAVKESVELNQLANSHVRRMSM